TQGELSDESPPPGSATLRQRLGVDRKPPPLGAPVAVASIAGSRRTCPQVCSPATGEQTGPVRPTEMQPDRPCSGPARRGRFKSAWVEPKRSIGLPCPPTGARAGPCPGVWASS